MPTRNSISILQLLLNYELLLPLLNLNGTEYLCVKERSYDLHSLKIIGYVHLIMCP